MWWDCILECIQVHTHTDTHVDVCGCTRVRTHTHTDMHTWICVVNENMYGKTGWNLLLCSCGVLWLTCAVGCPCRASSFSLMPLSVFSWGTNEAIQTSGLLPQSVFKYILFICWTSITTLKNRLNCVRNKEKKQLAGYVEWRKREALKVRQEISGKFPYASQLTFKNCLLWLRLSLCRGTSLSQSSAVLAIFSGQLASPLSVLALTHPSG